MSRKPNTNRSGGAWSEAEKRAVWNKGIVIPNYAPETWRRDKCGANIKWDEHGNRESQYGWEIDHINPVSNGGGDELSNLQPLHHRHNADKADKLNWTCPR